MWFAVVHAVTNPSALPSGGIVAIVLALISAVGGVVIAYLRGRTADEGRDSEGKGGTPAVQTAARTAAKTVADVYEDELARERREKDELQTKYDQLARDYRNLQQEYMDYMRRMTGGT